MKTGGEKVSEHGDEPTEIIIDFNKEHPVVLSSHDLISDGRVTWNQGQVRNLGAAKGHWALEFKEEREYEFRLFRWPEESGLSLSESAPPGDMDEAGQLYKAGVAFGVNKAWIRVAGQELQVEADGSQSFVSFKIRIPSGSHTLETGLVDDSGEERSAYYVNIL